jgi:hypothetical protein
MDASSESNNDNDKAHSSSAEANSTTVGGANNTEGSAAFDEFYTEVKEIEKR